MADLVGGRARALWKLSWLCVSYCTIKIHTSIQQLEVKPFISASWHGLLLTHENKQWSSAGLFTSTVVFGGFWFLTSKVGETDLVLACGKGSLIGLHMQNYKSLCAAVTICSTIVNIQAHIHIHTDTICILTSLFEKLSQLS